MSKLFSTSIKPAIRNEDGCFLVNLILNHSNEAILGYYDWDSNLFSSIDNERTYYWEDSLGRWYYVDNKPNNSNIYKSSYKKDIYETIFNFVAGFLLLFFIVGFSLSMQDAYKKAHEPQKFETRSGWEY